MVKDDIDSSGALLELFEVIEHFLRRLDIYTTIPPTIAMTAITSTVVKILVELLSVLALATKQLKQGKLSESVFMRYSTS